jgi:hypothetical protein
MPNDSAQFSPCSLLIAFPISVVARKFENSIHSRSYFLITSIPFSRAEDQQVAPKSIEGLRMTFRDYVCYESMFLFWADGRYTSVATALPTCHSYVEMDTEAGKYEWHVTDSRHAFLVFAPSKGKKQVYKFTFDTPTLATGYLSEDVRPYTFNFDRP